jgi:hypothetical protein
MNAFLLPGDIGEPGVDEAAAVVEIVTGPE